MRPLIYVFASTLAACAVGDNNDPTDQLVEHPQRVTVAPGESLAVVYATLRDAAGLHQGDASVPLSGGSIVLHRELMPDGAAQIVVDELLLTFEDVVLPTAYFHDGQVLTGIALRQASPPSAGALTLDWSLRSHGVVAPLESQTLSGVYVDVLTRQTDGDLRVDFFAMRADVMWSWADVVTLGDMFVHATAHGSID